LLLSVRKHELPLSSRAPIALHILERAPAAPTRYTRY
jgi:hypothetical protein